MSHALLKPGAAFAFRKTMTVAEQAMFTGISGNLGGLATTCLSQLGGPTRRIGSIALNFSAPVIVGDSVEAKAEIVSVAGDEATCRITCALLPSGATVVDGTATLVPFAKA